MDALYLNSSVSLELPANAENSAIVSLETPGFNVPEKDLRRFVTQPALPVLLLLPLQQPPVPHRSRQSGH